MSIMVSVFKTSVHTFKDVKLLHPHINRFLGHTNWNFDLEDCDKVFRVEASAMEVDLVINFFKTFGFDCEELL